jgi:hypothetical protein
MLSPNSVSIIRRVSFATAILLVASGFARAQDTTQAEQPATSGFSSSNDSRLPQIAELAVPNGMAALPPAPTPAASQDSSNGGWRHKAVSNLAFEIGLGPVAPTNKTYITWGGNLTLGAGVNFNKRFATLIEYQFISSKLPGAIIAQTGASGGHVHLWSLTLDPVVSLFPHSENDIYVTGGGGFYRKVTSFTNVLPAQFCNYYYCGIGYTPQVVGHFSSNQGGWNIGGGYQHRMGGMYGDSKMKLFVEARYLNVDSPAVRTQPNGLGTTSVGAGTKLIPVNVGIRW